MLDRCAASFPDGVHIVREVHQSPARVPFVDEHGFRTRVSMTRRSRSVLHDVMTTARRWRVTRSAFGAWRQFTARGEDRILKIHTEALKQPSGRSAGSDPNLYVPLAYGQTRRLLAALDLRPDDVLLDLGCGFGRVVALAARRDIDAAIGVELDADMAEQARRNLATLRGRRCHAEVRTGDAYFADLDQATVIVMFNPFGPDTMDAVLDRLHDSLKRRPRVVRVAYVNPVHQERLSERSWLAPVDVTRSLRFRHVITLWTTRQ